MNKIDISVSAIKSSDSNNKKAILQKKSMKKIAQQKTVAPKKIVAQMDDIFSIDIATDSTFAILLSAQQHGLEIYYYLPQSLYFDFTQQIVKAKVYKIELSPNKPHCKVISSENADLTTFDCILFRQDPPFDLNYITTTYLLEKIADRVLILNHPLAIRNFPEKIFISDFAKFIAPTAIVSNVDNLQDFAMQHQKIVLKPLYACGGEGIVVLDSDSKNLASIFSLMQKSYSSPIMVQKYLPEVKNGDIRVLLLDGKILGAVARIADDKDYRCNFHAGGVAVKVTLTKKQQEIANAVGKVLKEQNLFFVGIDLIGNFLTEINSTSPTCIKQINELCQTKLEDQIINKIITKIDNFKPLIK